MSSRRSDRNDEAVASTFTTLSARFRRRTRTRSGRPACSSCDRTGSRCRTRKPATGRRACRERRASSGGEDRRYADRLPCCGEATGRRPDCRCCRVGSKKSIGCRARRSAIIVERSARRRSGSCRGSRDQILRVTRWHASLLRREQRIVAVDGQRVAEVARRRDLRQRPIVHEHELEVRLERRADLIVRERTGNVTLVRTLEVVQRREVVDVLRADVDRSRPERRDGRRARRR